MEHKHVSWPCMLPQRAALSSKVPAVGCTHSSLLPPPPPPPRCNNEIKKALKVTQLILFDNGRNHTRSLEVAQEWVGGEGRGLGGGELWVCKMKKCNKCAEWDSVGWWNRSVARSELRFYKAAELLRNWRGTCIKQALLSVACRPADNWCRGCCCCLGWSFVSISIRRRWRWFINSAVWALDFLFLIFF